MQIDRCEDAVETELDSCSVSFSGWKILVDEFEESTSKLRRLVVRKARSIVAHDSGRCTEQPFIDLSKRLIEVVRDFNWYWFRKATIRDTCRSSPEKTLCRAITYEFKV